MILAQIKTLHLRVKFHLLVFLFAYDRNIFMKSKNNLNSTTIHQQLLLLTRSERKIVAEIIMYLQIVSDRKLFLDFDRSSLLAYCIKDLGYSESAAIRRIKALKLARSVPEVMESLKDGTLTLSQAAETQSLFEKKSQENRQALPVETKKEILKQIQGKGAHESQEHVRQVLNLPKKSRKIVIEASDEVFNRWIEFKGFMINKNWSDEKLLEHLLHTQTQALEETQRTALAKRSSGLPKTQQSKNQRYVSASMRSQLFATSSHCQWPGCTSIYGLEVDHVRPISANGQSVRENLRLLCQNHNRARVKR